jgi:hypothetical protein
MRPLLHRVKVNNVAWRLKLKAVRYSGRANGNRDVANSTCHERSAVFISVFGYIQRILGLDSKQPRDTLYRIIQT